MVAELHGTDEVCKTSQSGSTPPVTSIITDMSGYQTCFWQMPLYKKFGAKSSQFADVGKAMKEWMDRGRGKEFTWSELRTFAEYSWHMIGSIKSDLMDMSRENSLLKRENEKLKRAKT